MNAHTTKFTKGVACGTTLMDELVKYLVKVTQLSHLLVSVEKTCSKSISWQRSFLND